MQSFKPIRVKQAAQFLGVSSSTVRAWCNTGRLPYSLSAAGQRIFDQRELEAFKNKRLGTPVHDRTNTVFYVRSSSGSDISVATQVEKLTTAFGTPSEVYSDKASGLNENRRGLNRLLRDAAEPDSAITRICVTNKDRLTRFGFHYLDVFFSHLGVRVEVLDSDDTKEPHEVLMQDFMSLLASFSGKFYRLRGWEQRKRFLRDVEREVDTRAEQ